MAEIRFIGGAAATPSSYTWTLTGPATLAGTMTMAVRNAADSADISTVTISVANAATATAIATAFYEALRAQGVSGEFNMITWTNPSDAVLVGVGPDDGRPVVLKMTLATVTGVAGHTTPVVVTSSSPADVANVRNWEGGALPGNSDIAVFDSDLPVRYGLSSRTATTCKVRRTSKHRSDIGLPLIHPTYGFAEYLPTHFEHAGITVEIYDGQAGLCQVDCKSGSAVAIKITGSIPNSTQTPLVDVKGSSASFTISSVGGAYQIFSGTITSLTAISSVISIPNLLTASAITFNSCVARVQLTIATTAIVSNNSDVTWLAGSSATASTTTWTLVSNAGASGSIKVAIRNSDDTDDLDSVTVHVVSGDTPTAIATRLYNALAAATGRFSQVVWTNPSGGVITAVGPYSLDMTVDSVTTTTGYDTPTVTTAASQTVRGSVSRWQSTGLMGNITLGINGGLDCTTTPAPCTVGYITASTGATISDPYARITRPYSVTLDSCTPTDIVWNTGNISSQDVN